jgi:two-component system capsular synthesis response regulator RcsB
MVTKILVSEDIDSISLGVVTLLHQNFSADVSTAKYCDDALLKVKRAVYENKYFDLLITDLSFKADYREAKITSGEDLIKAVRKEQPDLKIIVYSIDDKPYKIKSLFEEQSINAFVSKGRESAIELIEAIDTVTAGGTYMSPQLSHISRDIVTLEIDEHDVLLLRYLSQGLTQPEISILLKNSGKTSSSTSSIEKRINKLKIYFRAQNTIHLISIVKDLGLI